MVKTSALTHVALLAVVAAIAFGLSMPALAWAGQTELTAASTLSADATTKEKPASTAFSKATKSVKVNKAKGWLVANGTYFFALSTDANKVVGQNGAISKKTGSKKQAWKITFDYNSQCYTIINASSGKALTVASKAKKGSKLYEAKLKNKTQRLTQLSEIESFNVPVPNQRWKLMSGRGGYYLVSAANEKMAVVFNGSRASLAKINLKNKNQYFWFVGYSGTYKKNGIGNGTYLVSSQTNGKLLNVANSKVTQGAKFQVGKELTLWGSMFKFVHYKSGYYRIMNFNSGFVLTEKAGKVVQYKATKKLKLNQLWKANIVGSNGTVQLINAKTKRALTVKGTGVTVAKANSSNKNQRWFINPTTTGITTVGEKALRRANACTRGSVTENMIVIDMTAHEYFLFHKANKKTKGAPWVLEDACRCSTGAGKSTKASTSLTSNYDKHVYGIPATWCIYVQHGSYIHSIVNYGPQGENQLGWYISNGCIRLPKRNAEYVFNNTKYHTTIIRYY